MLSSRACERLAGASYLLTHVTSVVAVILYGGTSVDPLGAGRSHVILGALLEIVLAIGVTGTGIALFALVFRYSRGGAAGYLALRTLEASVILAGVVVLLPLVAAPGSSAGPGLSGDVADGLGLVHDWTFLVGPGLIVPFHTVLLAVLLWRARLVPTWIPVLGVVGGPVVGVANLAVMFGLTEPIAAAAVPVFAWEISLAVCLLVRGFRPACRQVVLA